MSNQFLYTLSDVTGRTITLPVEIKWEFHGREDSIDLYEDQVIEEIIGKPFDFEVSRYSHKPYSNLGLTQINYKFYFYNGNNSDIPISVPSNWVNSYIPEGFQPEEIYYYANPFTKSFFKLDFYDTRNTTSQTNYFTIIIPTQQGATESASISPLIPNVQIKKPDIKLDFVGDKEGFFIYWLRNPDFININTFYMTAKFFDARYGVFVKMMTTQQANLPNPYTFDGSDYFYKKVVLDLNEKTYQIFDLNNVRIGVGSPIEWYEYVNPPS